MKNLTKKLIQISMITSFVFAVSFLLAPSFTFAATPACGSTITTNTTLDSDMLCSSTNGINIGASNIVLDCAGHSIKGGGNMGTRGVDNSSNNTVGFDHLTVKNCNITDFTLGIYEYNTSNNEITDNTFDYTGYAITIQNSSNNTIKNNIATNNGHDGIHMSFSNDNTITNNQFSLGYESGIFVVVGHNNIFTGNITNNNATGILLTANGSNDPLTLTNNTITNNTANSNLTNGIRLEFGSGSTISGNTTDSNGDAGFFITGGDHNTLDSNTANLNTQAGILIDDSNSNVTNNNISNNAQQCIKLSSADNILVKQNICRRNKKGIVSDPSFSNTISDNTLENIDEEAILLDSSTNDSVLRNIISFAGMGIVMNSSVGSIVNNNSVQNSTTSIIIVNSPNTVLSGNTLLNNIWNVPKVDIVSAGTLTSDVATTPIISCGSTITSNTVLTDDNNYLYNCPADGLIIGADNITLDCAGKTITGMGAGEGISLIGRTGVTIKNCNVSGFLDGINLLESSGNTIINNTANSNVNFGIFLYTNSSNNTISNNTASQNSNNGIYLALGCSNNTLTNNNSSSNSGHGICISDNSLSNTITSNTANLNSGGGLTFDTSSNNNIVNLNTVNSNIMGVYNTSSAFNTFTSNTFDSNGVGVYFDSSNDNIITSNTVSNSGGNGIEIYAGGNNLIKLNNSSSNVSGNGIVLWSSSNNNISSNITEHNNIGLQNDTGTLNVFDHNTSRYNDYYGLYIATSENNNITNNSIISNGYDGITVVNASSNNFTSNTVNSNAMYGFEVLYDSANNVLKNNLLSLNGILDIFLENLTLGNVLTGNTGTSNAVLDTDNDGVLDTADQCPTVKGTAAMMGCPFAVKTVIDMQTVDQQKSGVCGYDAKGKAKSECKNLLSGSEVRVFNREDANFVSLYKSKRPEKTKLDLIFEGGIGQVGSCTTDASGVCTVGTNTSGKYLMIAKYVDGVNTVYTGKYQNFKRSTESSEEEDDSDSDAKVVKNTLLTKKLHFIKTISPKGVVSYKAGTISVFTGSQLSVLYPEAPVWEGATELYPFVMTSDSDWTVDVCLQVPTGYSLKGVQDVNGTVLSTTNCSQSLVSGTPVVVLFSLADIGSPEPKIAMTLTTTHKGKKTKTDVTLDGIRRKSKDAGEKDLKGEINKKKAEEAANKPKIEVDNKAKVQGGEKKISDTAKKANDLQEVNKKKSDDIRKKSKDQQDKVKEILNKKQALINSKTSILVKVGLFFGNIGKGIREFASVLTSFLFR